MAAGGFAAGWAEAGLGAPAGGALFGVFAAAPPAAAGCGAAEPEPPAPLAPESGAELGCALVATGFAAGLTEEAGAADAGAAAAGLAPAALVPPGADAGWLGAAAGDAAEEDGAGELLSDASELCAAATGLFAPGTL